MTNGLVLINAGSITSSTGTVTKDASGIITFTGVTSAGYVSVNNCFSATYDNYLVLMECSNTTSGTSGRFRFRASGSDATGADYGRQQYFVDGTTEIGSRVTGQTYLNVIQITPTTDYNEIWIQAPFIAKKSTVMVRAVRGQNTLAARPSWWNEYAKTDATTSYDGFTFYHPTDTLTGRLQIYGLSQ